MSLVLVSALDSDFLLLISIWILPARQGKHGVSTRRAGQESPRRTHSCFRFAMSSFIFASSISTSFFSAFRLVLSVAVSFRVLSVNSVRSSERAALKRYAPCRSEERIKVSMRDDEREKIRQTLSKSFTCKLSVVVFRILPTNSSRVALIRVRATGGSKDCSRAL